MSPETEIRRRIRETGPIPFAEFMELALYWPAGGYYASRPAAAAPFGPAGDYYTSPLAHPVFGALLAMQLYQGWQLLNCPNPFVVVELGAGNGLLSRDIAAAAAQLPNRFGDGLRYLCLDRCNAAGSPYETAADGLARITAAGLPLRGMRGVILSNELLDAFPVHQVKMEGGQLREVYIAIDDSGALTETLAAPSTPALAARLEELNISLAEGQTAEINLQLDAWAGEVAAALAAGFVLTIDYGRPAAELYDSQLRPRGTLTAYYRHTQTDAPLRHIGRQDLTAQVDFTAVVNAGRRAGLTPLSLATQGTFLRNFGLDSFRRRLAAMPLSRRDLAANQAGLAALANPGGMGTFKVLTQGKGIGQPDLWGFAPAAAAAELAATMPVPLLTDKHIALPDGWPAAGAGEFELAWEQIFEVGGNG